MAIVERQVKKPFIQWKLTKYQQEWPEYFSAYTYGVMLSAPGAYVWLFEVTGNLGTIKSIQIQYYNDSLLDAPGYILIYDNIPSPTDAWTGKDAIETYKLINKSTTIASFGTPINSGKLYIAVITYQSTDFRISDLTVNCEGDDTDLSPLAVPRNPESAGEAYNYQAITFEFGIVNRSGSVLDGGQIQCSYDANDWSNPIVDMSAIQYPADNYQASVNASTFNPGTVYWRCRAKTAYSEWGEWAYDSFTAVEQTPYIQNYKLNGYYDVYQDRTSPIVLTWQQIISGITLTHSDIQYALPSDYDTWIDIDTVQGDSTTYTIPANTFPAIAGTSKSPPYGGIKLRVIAYNINGKASNDGRYIAFVTVDSAISVIGQKPRNGASVDETKPISFNITTANSITHTPPSDADMRWKTSGGEWQYLNHLADSLTPGTGGGDPLENSIVIPANTFPAAIIYYQVRVYNQDGVASNWSSEVYFSTIDAPSVSTPISPSGTIEDTDSDLVFRWSTSSTSGSTPTGADLQYSYDGITWLVLGHTDGTTQLTVSGGIIHAGTVQWQVRSYNRNGTPGEWSASATFVAHAAPRILDLITDGKPFTTFTWQATDQRDYHIVIDDDLVIGPVFDEVKTYQLTDYLEDGLHTVKIRVQNEMSVWSEWAETQFQVLNIPDGEIELQGSWDIDADLFWEDQATDAEYMVYRDGGLIGKTGSKAFADRVVLGEHRYHVIRRLSDGCYSISNTVSGSMSTRLTRVAPLVGGEWLALVKSENAKRSERFTRRRKVAYHHFSGNKFPTPEIGDQEELIGEYDAAWMHTEEGAEILDSLVGQAIIVKSRSGKVIIGVLEGYTSGDKKHFSGFTFELKQMDWEDYICDI